MSVAARHPAASLTLAGQSLWDNPSGANSVATKIATGLDVTTYHVYRTSVGWYQFLERPVALAEIMRPANTAPKAILVMMGGTTDIGFGVGGSLTYTREVSIANQWIAAGGTHVIATTTTPSVLFDASAVTQLGILNSAVRANADVAFNSVVDLAANASLDDHADTTYYSDGTHPTAAGATVIANLLSAAVVALL